MALPAAVAAVIAAAKTPAGKAVIGTALAVVGTIRDRRNPGDKRAGKLMKKGGEKLGEALGQKVRDEINRRRTP